MNNQVNNTKLGLIISPAQTLLKMEVGETIYIPIKKIKTPTLRMAAFRLKRARKGLFFVSEQGLINETLVTRLK